MLLPNLDKILISTIPKSKLTDKRRQLLEALDLKTVAEVLLYTPYRYENRYVISSLNVLINNICKSISKFYSRMAILIECENELIRIFGIDYENNPDFLELED